MAHGPDFATLFRSASRLPIATRICQSDWYPACTGLSIPGFRFPYVSPQFCHTAVQSTCCPSATTLVLALGPDLPRADQLYPGNLGYSAIRILTLFSLLIPAFSLPCSPQLLTVLLLPACNAPLPTFRFLSFGGAFQPRTFSAQGLSTSELLRTL